MARKRQSQELYVFMNGILVGTLMREATGNLSFTYNHDWLTLENSRPISISMPLTEIPYKGYVVESYFDNLLPDSEAIRKRIQVRFGVSSNNCFDLLALIGADCVGALQLHTTPRVANTRKVLISPITAKEIATLLKNYRAAPLGMDPKIDFRISIAGAQEKTALLWFDGKWCLPKGPTPSSHIIKLPIGRIKHSGIDLSDSVENEWLCLKILSAYDLPVNQAKIEIFEDLKTLVVERFDRRWSENGKWLMRLPQEDMCQALGLSSTLKYESDGGPGISKIMNILLGSQESSQDRMKFMKAVFLFWVLGATDGHAKNFSLSIESQGRYKLTPFYDVLSVYPLASDRQLEWKKLKMAMSVKEKNRHYLWQTIALRHWLSTASQCQFSSKIMQKIVEDVFDTMEKVIDEVKNGLPLDFPEKISTPIFSGMREVKARFRATM